MTDFSRGEPLSHFWILFDVVYFVGRSIGFIVANMADATSESDDHILDSYRPFIADVPPTAFGEPFPQPPDNRSDAEVHAVIRSLRRRIDSNNFSPPIPLADFCLIAEERWRDEGEAFCQRWICHLL
jgi:hypothetical protein